jgi:hypothetical protein
MYNKIAQTRHSMKTMWGCVAVIIVAVILAIATNAYFLLFVIPCMIMMGAMMWIMMGSATRGGRQK